MFDNVDNFSGRIRIVNNPLVSQVPQLSKGRYKLLKDGFRHVWAILFEHLKLWMGLGVINGMTAKNVAYRKEERSHSVVICTTKCQGALKSQQLLSKSSKAHLTIRMYREERKRLNQKETEWYVANSARVYFYSKLWYLNTCFLGDIKTHRGRLLCPRQSTQWQWFTLFWSRNHVVKQLFCVCRSAVYI